MIGKKGFFIFFMALAALLFPCAVTENQASAICFDTQPEESCVYVEIADTYQKRQTGLMGRERLDEDSGMLFVFPDEGFHSFWMKNTLIPLDIIWINSSGHIVYIKEAAPCVKDPCIGYRPEKKANYVLEVEMGYAKRKGLMVGGTSSIITSTQNGPLMGRIRNLCLL